MSAVGLREFQRDPRRAVWISPHGAVVTDKALRVDPDGAAMEWFVADLDRAAEGRRIEEEWMDMLSIGGDTDIHYRAIGTRWAR